MNCSICQQKLEESRIEGLMFLGVPEREWKCVLCSEQNTKKTKMIYTGFTGSGAMFVDSVSQISGIEKEPNDYNDLQVEDNEE